MSADFWAGYLSGAAGIIIGNPLDLIKTRLQAGPAAAPASRSATPEAINWRNAGNYVRGMYTAKYLPRPLQHKRLCNPS